MNVPGFYYFGRDCNNAKQLIEASFAVSCRSYQAYSQIPDLVWLKKRGGTIFMFGPPGNAEFFGNGILIHGSEIMRSLVLLRIVNAVLFYADYCSFHSSRCFPRAQGYVRTKCELFIV